MQTSFSKPRIINVLPPGAFNELVSMVSDINTEPVTPAVAAFAECPPHDFDRAGYCTRCGTPVEDQ